MLAAEPPAPEPPSAEAPARSRPGVGWVLGGGAPPAAPAQPSQVEGPLLTWPAGGAILLGLAALVEGVAAGTPAGDVLFNAIAAATLGLLLGAVISLVRA